MGISFKTSVLLLLSLISMGCSKGFEAVSPVPTESASKSTNEQAQVSAPNQNQLPTSGRSPAPLPISSPISSPVPAPVTVPAPTPTPAPAPSSTPVAVSVSLPAPAPTNSPYAFLTTATSFFSNYRPSQVTKNCGANNWYQIPGNTDYFLGRMNLSSTCNDNWTLVLGKMNWTTLQISVVKTLIQMPAAIQAGRFTLTTAYDPSVILFNNEYWVAFECHGLGFPGTVGSCMAPFDLTRGLDVNRAYVAIQGVSYKASSPHKFSGSVPKLMSYNGKAYLYWSAVRIEKSSDKWIPQDTIHTRGIQLTFDSQNRLVPVAYGVEMPADHPYSFVVFATNPSDPRSNTVADSFQILNIGSYFYLIGTMGGQGCMIPTDKVEGCYRLTIRRSSSPLGQNIFNGTAVAEAQLPSNPNEYFHFYTDPKGKLEMAGLMLPPFAGVNQIPAGYYFFSIPTSGSFLNPGSINADPLLSSSQSPLASVVNQAYSILLERAADNVGLQSSLSALSQGTSIDALLMSLYRSPEFQSKYRIGTLSNGDFVGFCYLLLFQRAPDSEGFNWALNALNSGQHSKESLFQSLIQSTEFKKLYPYLTR